MSIVTDVSNNLISYTLNTSTPGVVILTGMTYNYSSGANTVATLPNNVTEIAENFANGNNTPNVNNITQLIIGENVNHFRKSICNNWTSLTHLRINIKDAPTIDTDNVYVNSLYTDKYSLSFQDSPLNTITMYYVFHLLNTTNLLLYALKRGIVTLNIIDILIITTPSQSDFTFTGGATRYNFNNVTTLNILDSRNVISNAFFNFNSLTHVNMPLVTSIGNVAFNNCLALTRVNMPRITSIGSNSFRFCPINIQSLQQLYYQGFLDLKTNTTYGFSSDTRSQIQPYSITDSIITGIPAPISGSYYITIPSSITAIAANAIATNATFLTALTISSSVTTIGVSAFSGCSNLTSVVLPSPPPIILDSYAFSGTNVLPSFLQTMRNQGYGYDNLVNAGFTNVPVNTVFPPLSELVGAGYNASELRVAGYPIDDLRIAGYSDSQILAAEYPASDLRIGGYPASDVREAGYSIANLRTGGYSDPQILAAGYTAKNLFDEGFIASNLLTAGYPVSDLLTAGYSIDEVRIGGYPASDVRQAGYSIANLRTGGYSDPQILGAGYTASQLRTAQYTATQLRTPGGYPAYDLRVAGYFVSDLLIAGYTKSDILAAGYTASQLRVNGYFVSDLRTAGYAPFALYEGGYTAIDFFNAGGYTANELSPYFSPTTLIDAGFQGVTCFNENSKILCLVNGQEKEILIQNIRSGVLVKTFSSGYKPVCMIGTSVIYNPGTDERFKDRLFICKKEKYPELNEDLIITGCHSILVDEITPLQRAQIIVNMGAIYETENNYRLNAVIDERAEPYNCAGKFNIYHIALENNNYIANYGVYANGLLVETCSKRYLKELSKMRLL